MSVLQVVRVGEIRKRLIPFDAACLGLPCARKIRTKLRRMWPETLALENARGPAEKPL